MRRELSINFCHYTPDYDEFSSLPGWAKETLKEHEKDGRDPIYTREQLENAETHDEYWNAAMNEMRYTGYMHNYMRMYWGKKILEWSKTPEEAYRNDALSQQQILRRRPGSQLLCKRRVGLRPARPGLAGEGRLRQGALHVRRGSGT